VPADILSGLATIFDYHGQFYDTLDTIILLCISLMESSANIGLQKEQYFWRTNIHVHVHAYTLKIEVLHVHVPL
jgi:hypothetical protein